MKPETVDYGIYLVTDRGLSRGRPTIEVVAAAVRGGVTVVQLREKGAETRDFVKEALAVRRLLEARGIPLIVNDRIDVALAVSADGVHLGQKDMPIDMARKILGPDKIIGISAESVADAVAAEKAGADYLGVSPIYATPTKTDTVAALGLEGLRQIREAVDLPLVGIGGLNAGNAAEAIRHGADGIAVVSAIVSADDPETAARELSRIVAEAKVREM
ncbi:MAG: thiamine phosphate synthase [Desulfobacterales bacterium]|nr:thiamine phosphate synthase [Desulfobacterales bacterium]